MEMALIIACIYNPDQKNSDSIDQAGDSYGDACDNCPHHANEDQADQNCNGDGDVCDKFGTTEVPFVADCGSAKMPEEINLFWHLKYPGDDVILWGFDNQIQLIGK